MLTFRKIWTKELNDFLLSTKGMKRQDAYKLFNEKYPAITDVTETAFYNQRSRVGAADKSKGSSHNRTPRPLYSEQIKKGYVRIKIAQPNVWVSKAKWVYMETHPDEYEIIQKERANYIFLDGNSRNFNPDNIARVPLYLMTIFNNLGGCEKEQPDITRLRVTMARLKWEQLNIGEKLGLVADGGGGRVFIDYRNARAREYHRRPEVRERINARARAARTENPEKYKKILERNKLRRRKARCST